MNLADNATKVLVVAPAGTAGEVFLVQQVRLAIRDQSCVLLSAPTGIGKTIVALYPAVEHAPPAHRACYPEGERTATCEILDELYISTKNLYFKKIKKEFSR